MRTYSRWIEISKGDEQPQRDNLKGTQLLTSIVRSRNPEIQKILKTRPKIRGYKKVRIAKDKTYVVASTLARKHQIVGSYLGLAAAHIPEIFTVFESNVIEKFDSCQLKNDTACEIADWASSLEQILPVGINIYNEDIIDFMCRCYREYSILDLDLMNCLDEFSIGEIARATNCAAADDCLLALWHTPDRRKGNSKYRLNHVIRPAVRKRLEKWFHIKDDVKIDYYESQEGTNTGYPMRVELLILKRKRKTI